MARNPLNRRRSKRRRRHTDTQKNTETWRGADKKKVQKKRLFNSLVNATLKKKKRLFSRLHIPG